MKKFTLLFVLFFLSSLLYSEEEWIFSDIGYYVSSGVSFKATPSKFEDEGTTTFSLLSGEVAIGLTPLEDLSVEGKIGYNLNYLSGVTSFNKLPLELEAEMRFSGFYFGLEAQYSNIWEYNDFSLSPFFSFYFGSSFEKEWDITLPIVSGKAKGRMESWLKGNVGAKISYNGLDLHTPYLGFYFTMTSGRVTMKEEIEEIRAKQERKFREKLPFAFSIGDELEIMEDIYLNGELKFAGEFSVSVNLKYILK